MSTTTQHHAELICDYFVKSVKLNDLPKEATYTDVFVDKFGIDDSRELVRKAHTRPAEFSTLVIIVRTDFITLEAQNALLKVLEEPPLSTKFIFIVPPDFSMIETLRSRFSPRPLDSYSSPANENKAFELFINANYQERLSAIENSSKEKDTDWQRQIKIGLIEHVKKANVSSSSLADLEYVARKLLTRGASNKMLLEHAALILGTRL